MAVVGDNKTQGEIVAPEDKLMAMARKAAQESSGNAQTNALLSAILQALNAKDTNVYLDGKEISRNTVQHINRDTRRTGKLALIV